MILQSDPNSIDGGGQVILDALAAIIVAQQQAYDGGDGGGAASHPQQQLSKGLYAAARVLREAMGAVTSVSTFLFAQGATFEVLPVLDDSIATLNAAAADAVRVTSPSSPASSSPSFSSSSASLVVVGGQSSTTRNLETLARLAGTNNPVLVSKGPRADAFVAARLAGQLLCNFDQVDALGEAFDGDGSPRCFGDGSVTPSHAAANAASSEEHGRHKLEAPLSIATTIQLYAGNGGMVVAETEPLSTDGNDNTGNLHRGLLVSENADVLTFLYRRAAPAAGLATVEWVVPGIHSNFPVPLLLTINQDVAVLTYGSTRYDPMPLANPAAECKPGPCVLHVGTSPPTPDDDFSGCLLSLKVFYGITLVAHPADEGSQQQMLNPFAPTTTATTTETGVCTVVCETTPTTTPTATTPSTTPTSTTTFTSTPSSSLTTTQTTSGTSTKTSTATTTTTPTTTTSATSSATTSATSTPTTTNVFACKGCYG